MVYLQILGKAGQNFSLQVGVIQGCELCREFVLFDFCGEPGNGERGRNRTFNLLIKSQLLCQLSYAPFNDLRKSFPRM